MRRVDGYKNKPVGDQGINPMKTFFVVERQNKNAGGIIIEHCSQAQSSPSEYLRAPLNKENKRNIPLEYHQISSQISATRRK